MSYNFYDIKESYQYDLLQSLSDLENPSTFTDSFFPPPPKEEENYVTELMDLISPSYSFIGGDKKDAFYDFGADLLSQDTSFEEPESQEELPYINEIQDYISLSNKKVEFFGLPPLSTDDLSYIPVQLKLNAPLSPNDSMDALSLLVGSPNYNSTNNDGSSSPHMDCTSQPSSPFLSPTQNTVDIKTEQVDQSTYLDSFFAQNNLTQIAPSTDDIINIETIENESKYNILPHINTACGNINKTDYFKSEMRKEQLNRYRMKRMKRKYNRPVSASRSESAKGRLRGQNGRFIKKSSNSMNKHTPNMPQNNPCPPPFMYNPLLNTPMHINPPLMNPFHTMIIPQ